MHARLASRLGAAAATTVLLLAAGCTGSDDSPGAPETPDSPTAGSPSGETSIAPEQPSGTFSSTATSSTAEPLVDRLMPTGEVPGLNPQWQWQDGDTGQPTDAPFGLCAKADLLSIGATEVVARTYFPPDDSDDNAGEQVAEFPDTATANRAWAVLASWHKRCGTTLSADNNLHVGRFSSVPVQQGTARWYLLSWTPPGEETGRFEALGMVLNGTRIAVFKIDNSGQDHDYPPGREPMVGMLVGGAPWLD
ncbi:MAG: hypothetical protein JF565_11255 [Propionibacteriales bacterium]|nr:hypothetical protein [Propionibacteriales bacterium]